MLIDEAFKQLAERMIQIMQDNIRNKQIPRVTPSKGEFQSVVDASGELANSLTYRIDGYSLEILANSYWRDVVYGREPGEIPSVEDIFRWMGNKGVKGNPSVIAFNIGAYGSSIFQKFNGQDSGLFAEATDDSILQEFNEQLSNELINGIIQLP